MYRFNTIPIKIPADFFAEIDKLILKFMWKYKEPRVKTILKEKKKKNKLDVSYFSVSKVLHHCNNQSNVVLA